MSAQAPSKKGLGWALVPAFILGSMFVGWGVMVAYALDDPAFGVEPNYYEKAVHFDEQQAAERESRLLAWSLELESNIDAPATHLTLTVRDREGRFLEGAAVKAVAFHNARSSQPYGLEFRDTGRGRYTSRLPSSRPGVWEFRFELVLASARFLQVKRVELEAVRDL